MNSYRNDFPLLRRKINGIPLVYFDSAATSLKPATVINAITTHYQEHAGNPGRGEHVLSYEARSLVETTRREILSFFNANPEEYSVVFTKNATESLNLAFSLAVENTKRKTGAPAKLITTELEHHSNFLPSLRAHQEENLSLAIVPLTEEGTLSISALREITAQTNNGILSITAGSNVTGEKIDVDLISTLCHEHSITTIIDATQIIAHTKIDLRKIHVDFLAASAHKFFGPEGVGILVLRNSFLTDGLPLVFGGGSVTSVSSTAFLLKETPERFEAGTLNTAGIAGTKAALEYITTIGWKDLQEKEQSLVDYFIEKAQGFTPLLPILPYVRTQLPIFSFNLKGVHPHDVADFLDKAGVAVRAGYHCAEPLHQARKVTGSVRASLSITSTKEEIDYFFALLPKCQQKFAQ